MKQADFQERTAEDACAGALQHMAHVYLTAMHARG